jgi:hypothetical protein
MNEQELIKALNALREAITRSSATATATQRRAGARATAIAGVANDDAKASKKAVNALDREVERASRVVSSLHKATTRTRDAVIEVESAGRQLKRVTADLTSAVSGVSSALRTMSRSLSSIFAKIEDKAKGISVEVPGINLKSVDKTVDRLSATLMKLDGQLLSGATKVMDRLDGMSDRLGATTKALEQAMAKAQSYRPDIDMGAINTANQALLDLTSTSRGLDVALAELSRRVANNEVLPGKEAGALQASVRKVRGALYGLADHITKIVAKTPQGSEFLDAAAESAADRIDKLAYTTNRLRASFIDVIKVMRSFSRKGADAGAAGAATAVNSGGPPLPPIPPTTPTADMPDAPKGGRGFTKSFLASMSSTTGALGRLTAGLNSASGASAAVTSVLVSLARVGGVLADQYLAVSRMGYDASFSSLAYLNKQSIMLGRSFNETMKFMEDNAVLLSRSKNFEEFFSQVSSARGQLGRLGATAKEAQEATAQMKVSAIVAGVPLSQTGDIVGGLIPMFEALQKQVGMTAGAFAQLTSIAANNESVQRDLFGLNKEDRAARFKETVQTLSNIVALKGNTKATQELQQEMLNARTAKTKTRFEQAGRLMQVGAMTGMGAQAAELSQLLMKNPLTLSGTEEIRKTELLNQMQVALDTAQRSAVGPAQTAAFDAAQEVLDKAGISKQMKASAAVYQTAGGEGRGAVNDQFGKHVGTFGTIIQDLKTFIDGSMKSLDLLSPLTTAIIGIVGLLKMGKISSSLNTIASAATPTGPSIGQGPPAPAKAAGKPGVLARMGQAIGGAAKVVGGGFMGKLSAGVNTMLDPLAKGASALASGSKLGGLGSIAGSVAGGIGKFLGGLSRVTFWLSPIMGAVEEIFSGNLAQLFGEDGSIMGRVQGVIFGAFRSIVTGITDIFDTVAGWFGVDLNITGWFDRLIANFMSMLNEGKAKLWSMIGFDSWAKEAKDQARKWDDAAAKIKSGEAKTLTDVGEGIKKETDARKKAEEANKTAAAKHAESISKVTTVANAALDVQQTARAMGMASQVRAVTPQATPIVTPLSDIKPSIVTPAAEPAKPIIPPAVNKTVVSQLTKEAAAQQAQQQLQQPDALVLLVQKMVELLQQGNQTENRQAELLAQLLLAMGRTPVPLIPRVEDDVYSIVKG